MKWGLCWRGGAKVRKLKPAKLIWLICTVLITATLLSACAAKEVRLPAPYTYSPGAAFTANICNEEPRRVIKCVVMFEVIDEAAVTELTAYNFAIRNAVLIALGELTLEELTTDRDLKVIAESLVTQVNECLGSRIDLIIGAYFTEFLLS